MVISQKMVISPKGVRRQHRICPCCRSRGRQVEFIIIVIIVIMVNMVNILIMVIMVNIIIIMINMVNIIVISMVNIMIMLFAVDWRFAVPWLKAASHLPLASSGFLIVTIVINTIVTIVISCHHSY